MYDKLLHLTGCCYFVQFWSTVADVHCCNRCDCFSELAETHMATVNYSSYCKIYTSILPYIVKFYDFPKQLKHNWFCLIIFNLCCELAFLNCSQLYKGWLPLHKTHELYVATYLVTYALLVGLLTQLLLLFLGGWLAWRSSRYWHLPSRNLIIASSSLNPWEIASFPILFWLLLAHICGYTHMTSHPLPPFSQPLSSLLCFLCLHTHPRTNPENGRLAIMVAQTRSRFLCRAKPSQSPNWRWRLARSAIRRPPAL